MIKSALGNRHTDIQSHKAFDKNHTALHMQGGKQDEKMRIKYIYNREISASSEVKYM